MKLNLKKKKRKKNIMLFILEQWRGEKKKIAEEFLVKKMGKDIIDDKYALWERLWSNKLGFYVILWYGSLLCFNTCALVHFTPLTKPHYILQYVC